MKEIEADSFVMLDISQSGVQVLCPGSYETGERLVLSYSTTDQKTKNVTFLVVWSRSAAPINETLVYMGLEFQNTSKIAISRFKREFYAKDSIQKMLYLSKEKEKHNQNLRKFKRYNLPASVVRTVGYRAVNLSEGGAGLLRSNGIKKGRLIMLEFKLDEELLSLESSIVRCSKSSSVFETVFSIGVMFTNISANNTFRIRQCLEGPS